MFLHGSREDSPYRGATLAIHVARGLSTLMGAATVLLTYLAALEALRGKRPLALAAAALVAFIPQFLFISASVSNDNLVTALSSLALLLLLRALNRGLALSESLLLGAALAAAALTKLSGLALLLLALVALGLRSRQEASPSPLRACLALFPLVALGAGWWYARNWALYGDPLGLNLFRVAVGSGRRVVELASMAQDAQHIWMSFWAVFGWFNVVPAPALYFFYGALSLLSGLGLALLAASRKRRAAGPRAGNLALLLLWVAAYGALLVQWMGLVAAAQGRLLFPAISAVSILLMAGLVALLPPKLLTAALPTLLAAMAGIALLAPFLYIAPAYPRPTLVSEAEARDASQPLEVNFDGKMELLGYRLAGQALRPGEDLAITLYWKGLSHMDLNYTLFVHVFDALGRPLGQVDTLLRGGVYATSVWEPGEVLRAEYRIPLREPEARPVMVRIEAGLYLYPSLERLPAFDPWHRPLGTSVLVARAKFAAPPPQPPPPVREAPLGGQVLLVGYQGPEAALRPGQALEGRLWWKALDQPRKDYTVFVQLLGPGGLVAQYDAQPRGNSYPTSFWEAGEVVEDFFRLSLPQDMPPGVYRLIAGMYDAASGERLMSDGGDYVLLKEITLGSDSPSQ